MVTVVHDPAAHLSNLRVPVGPPVRALVACPTPPVCAQLAPRLFARRRQRDLTRLRAELGGGDGPLPVLDLDEQPDLLRGLSRLWADGIRALYVYGMAEQPGFARALEARWEGPVFDLHETLSAPLFEGPLALWLEPGVLRVRGASKAPEPVLIAGAERVLFACDGQPVAPPETRRPAAWRVYAWDPERRMGAFAGCVPPAARYPSEAALRTAWSAVSSFAAVSEAVLGIDSKLERALRPAAPTTVRLPVGKYVITGTDGAGKSTHVARLAATLRRCGTSVTVVKLYRQGAFLALANALSGRAANGAPLSVFRLSRVVKLIDSLRVLRDTLQPAAAAGDVLVLDRWTETHLAAARSQLGWELEHHPALTLYPTPDRAVWLSLPPAVALDRLAGRARLTADEHLEGLRGYAECFEGMAYGAHDLRLDARDDLEHNAKAIEASVLKHAASLPKRALKAQLRRVPDIGASQVMSRVESKVKPMGARCRVIVGHRPDLPVLGAEVLSLRTLGDLDRAPLQFWLEAWATQVLLDLRCSRFEAACAPLWPAAAARAWPDLVALGEVVHLLEREAEVIGWSLDGGEFWARVAGPVAGRRLSARYHRSVESLAAASGWELIK